MIASDTNLELDILGGMLAEKEFKEYALSWLAPDDFIDEKNKTAFCEIASAKDDSLTSLRLSCGTEYVARVVERYPVSIQESCKTLRALTIHRKRQQLAQKIISMDYRSLSAEQIQSVTESFNHLEDLEIRPDPEIGDFVDRAVGKVSSSYDAAKRKARPIGYPLFIPRIEQELLTAQPGEFWIVAGRPGHGKSTFLLNMATHGLKYNERPLYVTLEMPGEDHLIRAACRATRINSAAVRRGAITDDAYLRLCEQIEKYRATGLTFLDFDNIKTDTLIRRITAKVREKQSTAIFLDQINNVEVKGNRYEAITEASNKLRGLAKNLHIPVIAACQLNREIEKRTKDGAVKMKLSPPKLSDLKESGALEQDAVVVILLHWPHRIDPSQNLNEYSIKVAKSRYGDIGIIRDVKIYPEINLIRQEVEGQPGPHGDR